ATDQDVPTRGRLSLLTYLDESGDDSGFNARWTEGLGGNQSDYRVSSPLLLAGGQMTGAGGRTIAAGTQTTIAVAWDAFGDLVWERNDLPSGAIDMWTGAFEFGGKRQYFGCKLGSG